MKKNVAIVAVVLVVAILAAAWIAHFRSHAITDHKTADVAVTAPAPASTSAPETPQALGTTPSNSGLPHRTVVASPYTVASAAPSSGASSPNQNGSSVPGTAAEKSQPITDAEVLNKVVSPTGKPDDEFNRTKLMHNRLVTEPRDDIWASQAEQQLRNYLTATMGPERVNLVSVQCASSVCEIQAATRVPGNVSADLEDWQKFIFGMGGQPWWAEYQFSEPSNRVQETPDHQRALFIAFITRLTAGG